MIPVSWSPNGTELKSHHKCALLQVGTCPDMSLHVARHSNPSQVKSVTYKIDTCRYLRLVFGINRIGRGRFTQPIGMAE